MLAAPISISSPASTPNAALAAAPLRPSNSQPSSPFSAAFQTALKGGGNGGKMPSAGKPQDSSRGSAGAPAPATAAGSNSPALYLPGYVAPTLLPNLIEPTLPSASVQDPTRLAVSSSDATQGTTPSGQRLSVDTEGSGSADGGKARYTAKSAAGAFAAQALSQDPTVAVSLAPNTVNLGPIPSSTGDASTDSVMPGTPTKSSADSNLVPHFQNLLPNRDGGPDQFANLLSQSSQPKSNADFAQPGPQNVAPSSTQSTVAQTVLLAQPARPDLKFLNLQAITPAVAGAKASVSASAQPATNSGSQSNLQPPVNTSPALAETLEHSAAKSAAVGAPTLKFHDSSKIQSDNAVSSAPVAAVPPKSQSQEGSNGSAGNDSNSKADHFSNAPVARVDEKGFVQMLDAAAGTPAGGHSPPANPVAEVAATPAQAQAANSGTQPSTLSAASSRPAEPLPSASEGAPVVNAAHITVQQGQTEIRIEMQADSLGGVELRAHIAGDQIGASISVEHHDAQLALATDLPALHNALAEKNLHLQTLTVSQGTFSSLSGGPDQHAGQRGFAHPQPSMKFAYLEQPETAQVHAESSTEWTGSGRPGAGLSVVA
jgi:flagellar hook-length control protein FliK